MEELKNATSNHHPSPSNQKQQQDPNSPISRFSDIPPNPHSPPSPHTSHHLSSDDRIDLGEDVDIEIPPPQNKDNNNLIEEKKKREEEEHFAILATLNPFMENAAILKEDNSPIIESSINNHDVENSLDDLNDKDQINQETDQKEGKVKETIYDQVIEKDNLKDNEEEDEKDGGSSSENDPISKYERKTESEEVDL